MSLVLAGKFKREEMLLDKNEGTVTVEGNRDCEEDPSERSKPVVAHLPCLGAGSHSDDLVCRVDGCPGGCAARGLCWKHYMRERRYGSVSFRKRRYNLSPACRYCGTTDAGAFYRQYKSICKDCKKLRAVVRQMNAKVAKASPRQMKLEKTIK